jgi:hypothetical protein
MFTKEMAGAVEQFTNQIQSVGQNFSHNSHRLLRMPSNFSRNTLHQSDNFRPETLKNRPKHPTAKATIGRSYPPASLSLNSASAMGNGNRPSNRCDPHNKGKDRDASFWVIGEIEKTHFTLRHS